jgi:hypothetical protein
MKVFRIRRYSGYAGGCNYYHHADVIAPTWNSALKAAKEGRVRNWRRIDSFDTSDSNYCYYKYLYVVHESEQERPMIALTWLPSSRTYCIIEKEKKQNE